MTRQNLPPIFNAPPESEAARHQLRLALAELEQYVAKAGWDQSNRLFALARTNDLIEREPALAKELELEPGTGWTPIEQDLTPEQKQQPLDDMLAHLSWPNDVAGCALVVERLIVPPGVEEDLPTGDTDAALAQVREHPQRQEVRLAAAVLRDGTHTCVIRLRSHDDAASVLTGTDLVPQLVKALLLTFDVVTN